ncbi:origin recognition complex subunit 2-like isoform X2 [Gordionus sp. m RMFG-2023]|uniref:origin recognition complex subunit 2-like isoform X2 n=1 Tax=Gordionus sp. m RMFG-2023 TaxID=3053472 RepID=UPI0031FD3EFE
MEKQRYLNYKTHFTEWMYEMMNGFNVLLYGVGSKYDLLETYILNCLKNSFTHIVIQGYMVDINLKIITDTILNMIEIPQKFIQLGHIERSIDNFLSRPVWDEKSDSYKEFNWIRHHTPTPRSFLQESNSQDSCFFLINSTHPQNDNNGDEIKNDGNDASILSLKRVYSSLSVNSKKVFDIMTLEIMKFESDVSDLPSDDSIPFQNLLRLCREEFLVGNEIGLRIHLREFVDHEIITIKNDESGIEQIYFNISRRALSNFIHQIT